MGRGVLITKSICNVPSNFDNYWSLLTPLKKDKYKNDSDLSTKTLRDQLFELVVTRDNIGEIMWYIYTGLLITSIVQLKITTRGCASNPKTMEQNYQKFLDKLRIYLFISYCNTSKILK